MRAFLIAAVLLLAAPAAAHAADGSIWSRDLSLGARALAGGGHERQASSTSSACTGGAAAASSCARAVGQARGARGGRPRPRPRTARTVVRPNAPGPAGGGEPVVGSRLDAARGTHRRPGDARASLVRPQPCGTCPHSPGGLHGLAEDRPEKRLEGRREDRAVGATLRTGASLRRRPPHSRLEQLPARGVGGDRARDRALPREGERLERHRLQLPRRQVRPGVRGPRRRDAAQRHRRACGGLQHRLRGHRGPRHVLGEGADR